MVTIADIAQRAGVSKSTVSRYLNGGSVSDRTKRKIELIIKETDYIPNTFAQSLKAKKTNIIGTVVPRLDSYASSRTLIGIDEQLRDLNCQMLIANSSQNIERELESIYSLARQRVDGIILLATQITDSHLEAFNRIQIPVILVGQQHEDIHSLIHHDYHAAYEMGKYIFAKGHRRIAFIGVSEKDIAVGVMRKEGFKRAMEETGKCDVQYYETSFNMTDAVKQVSTILDEYQPSILVCATDNIALGAFKAASLRGLHIPDEISVTGFGGYEITGVIHPGITTINFHYKQAGRLAAQNIVKLTNGEQLEKITYSKYEMLERESVDNL